MKNELDVGHKKYLEQIQFINKKTGISEDKIPEYIKLILYTNYMKEHQSRQIITLERV